MTASKDVPDATTAARAAMIYPTNTTTVTITAITRIRSLDILFENGTLTSAPKQ